MSDLLIISNGGSGLWSCLDGRKFTLSSFWRIANERLVVVSHHHGLPELCGDLREIERALHRESFL
jgi:hypothetical protein